MIHEEGKKDRMLEARNSNPKLRDDLLFDTGATDCVETRLSWIFLASDKAWKVKKWIGDERAAPDSVETRRAACALEIHRGQTLAPGVYLGLVPVTLEPEGRCRLDGDGRIVDWAICMRRLPETDRADHRLQSGRLTDDHIRSIAAHIAHFHGCARADEQSTHFAALGAIEQRIGWAFGKLSDLEPTLIDAPEVREIEAWQRSFIRDNAELFRQRLRAGRIREGHGDLCLENLFVDDSGGVVGVDGAKRSQDFRLADVCSDIATLSLDLSLHGRVDLAERLLASYANASNDFDLYRLVSFYESCRANLERKTAEQLSRDPGVSLALRERASANARRYRRAAIAAGRRPFLPPMLIALSGQVASGKSSVARAIAHQIAAPIVHSDGVRDFLVYGRVSGSDHSLHESDWSRSFHPSLRTEVYNEVFARTEIVLASGRPVVVDGCFGTRALRARARALAQRFALPFFFVECVANEETIRQRLRERAHRAGIPSEAWHQIATDFRAKWEPVDELPDPEHIVLDTGRALSENVEELQSLLPIWPVALQ